MDRFWISVRPLISRTGRQARRLLAGNAYRIFGCRWVLFRCLCEDSGDARSWPVSFAAAFARWPITAGRPGKYAYSIRFRCIISFCREQDRPGPMDATAVIAECPGARWLREDQWEDRPFAAANCFPAAWRHLSLSETKSWDRSRSSGSIFLFSGSWVRTPRAAHQKRSTGGCLGGGTIGSVRGWTQDIERRPLLFQWSWEAFCSDVRLWLRPRSYGGAIR